MAAEDRIQLHSNTRKIFGRQGGTRAGVPPRIRIFSVTYHSPKSAYLSVITGWLKRPIWGRSINSVGLNINLALVLNNKD